MKKKASKKRILVAPLFAMLSALFQLKSVICDSHFMQIVLFPRYFGHMAANCNVYFIVIINWDSHPEAATF